MTVYIVIFVLPIILSRIIPLTPFPVFSWEYFAEDMLLIGYNHHMGNRDLGK